MTARITTVDWWGEKDSKEKNDHDNIIMNNNDYDLLLGIAEEQQV